MKGNVADMPDAWNAHPLHNLGQSGQATMGHLIKSTEKSTRDRIILHENGIFSMHLK